MDETLGASLTLTDAVWRGEVWRLWSGHLVHWSARHAALNLIALVPPLMIGRQVGRQLTWCLIAPPLIGLAVLVTPHVEYRGASALIVGLWFFAGLSAVREPRLRNAGILLMALATIKLAAEVSGLLPVPPDAMRATTAHLVGAIAGIVGAGIRKPPSLQSPAR
jgi:membrane associated rhomboid family serine protease